MQYVINLLPPHRKRLNLILGLLSRLKIVTIGLVIAGLLGTFSLFFTRLAIRAVIAPAKASLSALNTKIDGFADQQKRVAIINQRVTSGIKAASNNTDWSKLLVELAAITPSGVKFSALTGNAEIKNAWQLQATALNQREMLVFQAKVEESPMFGSSAITTTSLNQPDNPSAPISFTLKFKVENQK